jgi:hypothetical protein
MGKKCVCLTTVASKNVCISASKLITWKSKKNNIRITELHNRDTFAKIHSLHSVGHAVQ